MMDNQMFNPVRPFKFFCQKVLPVVYDDSLSYYELLCKVVDVLNKTIENENKLVDGYEELAKFVSDYFDNLDVQEEIDNKLDEMVESGEFMRIIEPYLIKTVKFYTTIDELYQSEETVGSYVIYNGEIYNIIENDNGYGIPTINGFAVRDFTEKRCLSYNGEKLFKFYLFGVPDEYVLQGSCYNESLRTSVYLFKKSDPTNIKMVFVSDAGNISSVDLGDVNGNDITFIDSLNKYCIIYDIGGEPYTNFILVDTQGNITDNVDNGESYKVSNISYDKKHDRLITFVNDKILIYKPVIEDDSFVLVNSVNCINPEILKPNNYSNTARQGSCCDKDGNFFMFSSIFYNDDYTKSIGRVSQIDTITGEIISYNDYQFNLTGSELESGFFIGTKLYLNGYKKFGAGYTGLTQIICDFENVKSETNIASRVYYNSSGSIANDGLSPDKPVNDLALACSIACNYDKGIVWMQTDEPQANANIIEPCIRGTLIITSSENNYRNLYSRFLITTEVGYFELQYVNIYQTDTNPSVRILGGNVVCCISKVVVNGSGNVSGRYIVLVGADRGTANANMYAGCRIVLYDIVANDCYALANITNGSYLGARAITGNNCDRVVDCDRGSYAVLDTAYNPITGFTHLGEQFGGLIHKGINGVVEL